LSQAGAIPVLYPTIVVAPPPSWQPLDAAWARLDAYDWLLFTSANAARVALSRCPSEVVWTQRARPRVAAVGAETARFLSTAGLRVDLVPGESNQEGLVAAWRDLPPGTRILFPQSSGAREVLATSFRERGIIIDTVVASVTHPIANLPELPLFDAAVFASPSALRAVSDRHGASALSAKNVVAIGPSTAAAAVTLGIQVTHAHTPGIDAVITALLEST
jgi:uroporphyrinogen-III synthase